MFLYLGKISASSCKKRGISYATNLERFMSLKVLAMIISSSSALGSYLFELPAVLKTERIFLSPKS